jgi:hypothetical protein
MTALAGTIVSGVLALTGMWTATWLVAVAALLTSTVLPGTAPAPRTSTAGHAGTVSAAPGVAHAAVEPPPAAAVPDELTDGSLGVHLMERTNTTQGRNPHEQRHPLLRHRLPAVCHVQEPAQRDGRPLPGEEHHRPARAARRAGRQGIRMVPTVFVGEKFVAGFRPSSLMELLPA